MFANQKDEDVKLEVRKVWTANRPVRLAYVIHQDDPLENVFPIIRHACSIWGGWHSPIVPVDDHWYILPPFRDLLRSYDPDCFLLPSRIPDGRFEELARRFTNTLDFGNMPFFIRDEPETAFRATPVEHVFRGGNPFHLHTLSFDTDTEIRLVMEAIWGAFTDSTTDRLRKLSECTGVEVVQVDATQRRDMIGEILDAMHTLMRDTTTRHITPRNASMTELASYHRGTGSWLLDNSPIIVLGGTIPDFCLFYSLSRFPLNVGWFPFDFERLAAITNPTFREVAQLPETTRQILFWLSRKLREDIHSQGLGHKLVYTSATFPLGDIQNHAGVLQKWLKALSFSEREVFDFVASKEPTRYLGVLPRVYELDSYSRQLVQFWEGASTTLLPSRTPRRAHNEDPLSIQWFQEASFEEVHLPHRNCLVSDILVDPVRTGGEARIGMDGSLSYLPTSCFIQSGATLSSIVWEMRIRIPAAEAVFQNLFHAAGYDFKITEKGRYLEETVRRFSGLEECSAAFADPLARRVFEKAIDHNQNTPGVHDEGVCLQRAEPRYLNFESILKSALMTETPQDVPDEQREEIAALLDGFMARKVFHRGLLLKCGYCFSADWYPLADLGVSFSCPRCRRITPLLRDAFAPSETQRSTEPEWFYRLDEMVYQCWKNGAWVTICALGKLQEENPVGFLFMPEIEAKRRDNNQVIQLDIVCSQVGNILLGEAKCPGNAIDSRQVNKYKSLAMDLKPEQLVFATAQAAWEESACKRFRSTIEEELSPLGVGVRLLEMG